MPGLRSLATGFCLVSCAFQNVAQARYIIQAIDEQLVDARITPVQDGGLFAPQRITSSAKATSSAEGIRQAFVDFSNDGEGKDDKKGAKGKKQQDDESHMDKLAELAKAGDQNKSSNNRGAEKVGQEKPPRAEDKVLVTTTTTGTVTNTRFREGTTKTTSLPCSDKGFTSVIVGVPSSKCTTNTHHTTTTTIHLPCGHKGFTMTGKGTATVTVTVAQPSCETSTTHTSTTHTSTTHTVVTTTTTKPVTTHATTVKKQIGCHDRASKTTHTGKYTNTVVEYNPQTCKTTTSTHQLPCQTHAYSSTHTGSVTDTVIVYTASECGKAGPTGQMTTRAKQSTLSTPGSTKTLTKRQVATMRIAEIPIGNLTNSHPSSSLSTSATHFREVQTNGVQEIPGVSYVYETYLTTPSEPPIPSTTNFIYVTLHDTSSEPAMRTVREVSTESSIDMARVRIVRVYSTVTVHRETKPTVSAGPERAGNNVADIQVHTLMGTPAYDPWFHGITTDANPEASANPSTLEQATLPNTSLEASTLPTTLSTKTKKPSKVRIIHETGTSKSTATATVEPIKPDDCKHKTFRIRTKVFYGDEKFNNLTIQNPSDTSEPTVPVLGSEDKSSARFYLDPSSSSLALSCSKSKALSGLVVVRDRDQDAYGSLLLGKEVGTARIGFGCCDGNKFGKEHPADRGELIVWKNDRFGSWLACERPVSKVMELKWWDVITNRGIDANTCAKVQLVGETMGEQEQHEEC